MKSVILQTILILLSTATVCCVYYEVDVINRLNDLFDFDHIIFLLDAKADSSRYIPTIANTGTGNVKFSPQTVYVFDDSCLDSDITTQLKDLSVTTSKNILLIVVAHTLQPGIVTRLLLNIVKMNQLNENVKIGLFLPNTSMESVVELLQWSASVGYGNIFCAFGSDTNNESFNVFRFNPFGKFDLIDVTNESVQNYFPDKLPNYHKHPLRLGQVDGWDVRYHDVKFWDTVVDVINASISVIPVAEDNGELNKSTGADLLLHISNKVNFNRLYPCRMELAVIVVPHAKPYASFVEYLKSATWKRLIAYAVIVIVTSSIVLILSGWLRKGKFLFFESVVDVLNLLMNDNSAIRYGQRNRADIFVIVPITFTGLIVVNGILSLFQSYLTLPIYERQINSFDDLYKSSVMILTNGIFWADWTIDTLDSRTNYGGWSAKVLRTDFPHLRDEYSRFNNSVAYIGTGHDARAFVLAQQRLDLKAYHIIDQPLAKVPFSFKELRDVPIIGRINEIIHLCQSAGLLEKWIEDENEILVTEIYNANLELNKSDNLSVVDEAFSIPSLVWFGWASSVIAFVCEVFWYKVAKAARQYRKFCCRFKVPCRIKRRKVCCCK